MTVLYAVAAVLLIGALILVHETGHYVVGRIFGVGVKVFSIGFGPRLFGVKVGQTDFRVSAIPFGGYVRWVGADPFADGGADDDDWIDAKGSFVHKPAWQRLLVVLAGPATNLVLPVVVFTALMFAGEPQPIADVGRVEREGAAWNAGLRAGDRLVEVDGQPVLTWVDVIDSFIADEADPVEIVVERDGARLPLTLASADVDLPLTPWDYGFDNDAPDTTLVVDDPASPAARAGLRTGDKLTAIDGAPVRSFFELERALARANQVRIEASRGAEALDLTVVAESGWASSPALVDDDTYRRFGLASATLSVASFAEGSAAEKAGVRVGDRLLRVAGRDVYAWTDVVRAVAESAEGEGEAQEARPVELIVRRDGTVATIVATPDVQEVTDDLGRYRIRPMLGIGGGGAWIAAPEVPREYPLPQAFVRGANETYLLGSFVVKQVGLLVTGGASVQKSLGGPPEIFRQAMAAAERGVFDYARLMGQLSISLGVLNLLPVPVLDGGQIVMYAAELVRGRPLPVRLRERLQQVGVVMLLTLLLFVLVFDIHRWITES